MATRATPDAEHVADRLHSAAIHLLRQVRREDAATGLSAARLSALSVVVFGGPLTLGELAAAEQVSAPTISRIAAALDAEGLLRRTADAGDARAVRVRATPKGTRVLQQGRRRRVARLAAALRELPARDLATLDAAAEVLHRVLEAGRTQPV
jgi:DNA-binding MarR family transcriptional regulator